MTHHLDPPLTYLFFFFFFFNEIQYFHSHAMNLVVQINVYLHAIALLEQNI